MTDEQTLEALIALVAVERDRLLGYPADELHMDPEDALAQGIDSLVAEGFDIDQIVLPDDREKLGLA